MTNTILLKKYTNRRLYDTENSCYVTLEEVADMIRTGKTVAIVDAKTKEDVTAFILTQIITEEAKKKNILMPVPVLHLIIRHGDNTLGEFMEKYLQRTIQNYLTYKKAFDDQVKQWLDLGMDISMRAPKPGPTPPPFGNLFDLFPYGPGKGRPENAPPASAAEKKADGNEEPES
ncbi:MAG: polyhydroxyalkanoate synthesis regulator DNA-binding domain-containing protein [Thermodesulfobacteriota bacterium]